MRTLRELMGIFLKDARPFSKREKVVFGIIAPLALFAACVLAEILSKL